jgi:hypothetical protein
METQQNQITSRKPYQKPQVERINLVVEEAVLSGCKQSGTTNVGYVGCTKDLSFCLNIAS